MDDHDTSRITFLRRRAALGAAALIVVAVAAALLTSGGSSAKHTASLPSAVHPSTTPTVPRVVVPAQSGAAREAAAVERVRLREPFVVGGGGTRKEVALTFDDGPGPYTPMVLDVLDREHAPATFFVVTQMLRYFQPALERELREGFVVGDHTANHPLLAHLSRTDQIGQIDGAAAALEDAGAPHTILFRPPYGSYDTTTTAILARQHLLGVLWNVDARDFARPGTDVIVHSVLNSVKPGAIVELHDAGGNRTQTVAALPRIIHGLRRRGYTLVTVPRLMLDDPPSGAQVLPPGLRESPAGG